MRFLFMLSMLIVLTGCGVTNPSANPQEVTYVTNEPYLFGDIGAFEDIVVGPGSLGLGWRNQIKYRKNYLPWTMTEYFSPPNGAGSSKSEDEKNSDTRIQSVDDINMEVEVNVVRGFKYSPVTNEYSKEKFKKIMREFFEHYQSAWTDRFRAPFRAQIRKLLSKETYSSAKKGRAQLGDILKGYLDKSFKEAGTPYYVISVDISNINPPQRLLQEQELSKAVQIKRVRQKLQQELQVSKEAVMLQEATNLKKALSITPKYLELKSLQIKESYAEGFNTLIKGDNKNIQKTIFIPYGTPVSAK